MKRMLFMVLVAALLGLASDGRLSAQQSRAEVALRSAKELETVRGDLKGAIEQYTRIAEEHRDNRPIAAEALLRLAACYQKLGDSQARGVYERIVKEFGDQEFAIAQARARLVNVRVPASRESVPTDRAVWRVVDGGDIYGKISQDGRYIPYTDWEQNGDLFIHDRVTGANRRVTQSGSVGANQQGGEYAEETAFSRDGRQLAFAWFSNERYQLRVVRADGTGIPEHRVLFDNPDVKWIWPEDWSPDGRLIAVGLQRTDGTAQIGVLSAADGSLRVLKSEEWRGYMRLAFSPDGRYLAYDLRGSETHARDVYILAVDGSQEIPAVVHRGDDALVGWAPEGRRLIFTSDRAGSVGLWYVRFAAGRIEGSPELIRPQIGRMEIISLTTDGSLYASTWAGLTGEIKVGSFDFHTGNFLAPPEDAGHKLGDSYTAPQWSHDGMFLAYLSRPRSRTSEQVLTVRDLKTGEVRELRPKLAQFGYVWAPDGAHVFLVGRDFKNRQGMYRLSVEKGELSTVLLPEAAEQIFLPIFSSHGQRFYYRRLTESRESVLMERDAHSGEEREAARGVQVGVSTARRKTYSRREIPGASGGVIIERDVESGREREVFRHDALASLFSLSASAGAFTGGTGRLGDSGSIGVAVNDPSAKSTVWLSVPLDGSAPRELIRAPETERLTFLTVSPDAKYLYVRKDRLRTGSAPRGGELWRVPLAGGQPQRVELQHVSVDHLPSRPGGFSVHPDGRRVAFVTNPAAPNVPYEVWVLENFLPAASR